eukprot:945495-Karenia_brevis.AAC.1
MTDVRSPASATARGVVRPASREPAPEPPRQVQRSQMTQRWNGGNPKPPPPVDHARRQLLPIPPVPPEPTSASHVEAYEAQF